MTQAFDLSILGVQKNIPKVNFTSYSGVFEAPEKFGKTAMSALYPNAVLLAFEKGYKAQVINKVDINKWDDFVAFVDKLTTHRANIGESIQTIVIDTVDEAYPLVESYMCKKEGKKDGKKYPTKKDIPYGQGWALHDKYFKEQIRRIYALGFNILYLTHSQIKQIKPKNGEPYDVHVSTMVDRCANIVFAECDYIIHGERVKVDLGNGNFAMKRALVVKGNDETVAGNRVYFDEDIIFDSEEEAMAKFQDKFEEGIKRNLTKAGITTDIEVLKEQQKEELAKEVEKYIEETTTFSNERLVEMIKEQFAKASEEKQGKMTGYMSGNGITSLADPDAIDVEHLEMILEILG